ncbi:MAG: phosphopantetheine-binding protein [Pseudonocardiaceae bacterium]
MDGLRDEEILAGIRTEAKVIVPDLDLSQLDSGAHIADLGINSMQTLELVARLEDRFGVALPDYELSGVESVADLMRVVARASTEVD